jgi:drug/metabolite transporter (DMT)-like permease
MSKGGMPAVPAPVLALLSAALFGAGTPLAKLLTGSLDPWLLAGLLYLGSGLGLGLVRLATRGRVAETPLARADLPRLAAVILAGGVAAPVLLMAGLARSDASSASLLLNLEGLATLAIAWLVFRENVDRRIFAGAMAILAGAVVLSWPGGGGGVGLDGGGAVRLDAGALLVAAACLGWGIDNNLTRSLSAADPMQVAMIKGLVAGTVNLGLGLAIGAASPGFAMPDLATGAAAMAVGVLGYGVSLTLYMLALRHLGSARTGAYFSTAPFIGAALGIVLFDETVSGRLLAAAGLMAFGVVLHLLEDHEHDHTHEPLEHAHRHTHDEHHHHQHAPGDPSGEPHAHSHRHAPLIHRHPHYPDLHHRHGHGHRPTDDTGEARR